MPNGIIRVTVSNVPGTDVVVNIPEGSNARQAIAAANITNYAGKTLSIGARTVSEGDLVRDGDCLMLVNRTVKGAE